VYLHEFGHTLGFDHEFENPDSIQYFRSGVDYYKIFEHAFQWDRRMADKILMRKKIIAGEEKPFDPHSVMGYQQILIGNLYKEGIEMEPSATLSSGDKSYVAQRYAGRPNGQKAVIPDFANAGDASYGPGSVYDWPDGCVSFLLPKAFTRVGGDRSSIIFATADNTGEIYLRKGSAGNPEAYGKTLKKMQSKPIFLAGISFESEMHGSGGSGNSSHSTSQAVFSATGKSSSGATSDMHIRIIDFEFSDGTKITGTMIHVRNGMIKDALDELVKSLTPNGQK
jgi:hypothetical protein